jgi:hypothetical protein
MDTPETTVDDHDTIRASAQPERPPAPVVAKRRFADASRTGVPHDKVQRHARVRRADYPHHDGQHTWPALARRHRSLVMAAADQKRQYRQEDEPVHLQD